MALTHPIIIMKWSVLGLTASLWGHGAALKNGQLARLRNNTMPPTRCKPPVLTILKKKSYFSIAIHDKAML